MMRGILFDLDGVLYNSEKPVDGSPEAVHVDVDIDVLVHVDGFSNPIHKLRSRLPAKPGDL